MIIYHIWDKLTTCFWDDCGVKVGLLGMYCKEHTPDFEYPIIQISLKYPFIRKIRNKEEWCNG